MRDWCTEKGIYTASAINLYILIIMKSLNDESEDV